MPYPRWVEPDPAYNLREVAQNLYIGAEFSPRHRPGGGDWALVVDLYGSSATPGRIGIYGNGLLLRIPFDDGNVFPEGVLDRMYPLVRDALEAGCPVLIHCQAGLSRSASAAYAMMRRIYGFSHHKALGRVKIRPEFPRVDTLKSARRWVRARS